jgi:hypothetical protein
MADNHELGNAMSDYRKGVDVIYLATCSRDARLTRICVASIRYFYPDVPIKLLPGESLQPGLAEELQKYWNVGLVDLPVGDYGWGLVKIEPLFGPPGQKFMVMDVDTVFTGRILDVRAQSDAPFFVDDEQLSDPDSRTLYYDWDKLRDIDPKVQSAIPAFNVGQWFGTAGLVKREEFDRWIEWILPRRLIYQQYFMGGDQGVMNYVLLQKEAFEGLRIERHTIMRWPAYSMDGLDLDSVANKRAPPLVIHWAGLKKTFLHDMIGGDLLQFFEDFYYRKLPGGGLRRIFALWYHVWLQWSHKVKQRVKLRYRMWFGGLMPKKTAPTLVKPIIRT